MLDTDFFITKICFANLWSSKKVNYTWKCLVGCLHYKDKAYPGNKI